MESCCRPWVRVLAILLFTATCSRAFAQALRGANRAAANVDYATAHLSRKLPAERATKPITTDGVLNEEDWARAPMATDFLQVEPRQGDPASEATEVRMLYDDDRLYIGVF